MAPAADLELAEARRLLDSGHNLDAGLADALTTIALSEVASTSLMVAMEMYPSTVADPSTSTIAAPALHSVAASALSTATIAASPMEDHAEADPGDEAPMEIADIVHRRRPDHHHPQNIYTCLCRHLWRHLLRHRLHHPPLDRRRHLSGAEVRCRGPATQAGNLLVGAVRKVFQVAATRSNFIATLQTAVGQSSFAPATALIQSWMTDPARQGGDTLLLPCKSVPLRYGAPGRTPRPAPHALTTSMPRSPPAQPRSVQQDACHGCPALPGCLPLPHHLYRSIENGSYLDWGLTSSPLLDVSPITGLTSISANAFQALAPTLLRRCRPPSASRRSRLRQR